MTTERAKDFKGTLLQLVRTLGRYRLSLVTAIVFAILSTIFNIAGPKVLAKATTALATGWVAKLRGTGSIDFVYIGRVLLFLLGMYLLSSAFSFIQGWLMTGLSQKVCYDFRRQISEKINRLPLAYFEKRTVGEVLSRITNDVDTLGQSLNQSITQLITSVTTMIGVLIMMLSISPRMTLIALLILPVSLALVLVVVRFSQKYFKAQQATLGVVNGQVEEVYAGHNVVKAFNREAVVLNDFNAANDKLYESAWKSQFLSGLMMPIMNFVGNLGYVAVAIVGSSSGYAGSFVQAANVGVSQSIAGLPMYSALWYRLIILVVMLTIAAVYIYLYAQRIKRDPTRSLMYEFDRQREEKVDLNDLPELTGTRKLVLLVMGATFALLIVGVLKWGWYINELSALFLGMGIVVGFVARVGFDGFGRLFSRGVADFAAGALAVGFARGILIVLEGGNILHTILYGASGLLTSLPSSLTVLGMYVFQNFLNLLIPSASGQAATSLPILLPMGDMADITRQTTCIIFQIGNGLSNILVPTSGTFMVALTMAKVPYGKWAKWFIPLLGLQFAAGAVLVLIANAIRLGPM